MNLSAVIQQLRQYATVFASNVGGAVEFTNALEDTSNLNLPAAYVIPLDDVAGDNELMNGLIQQVKERIGVIVEIDASADRRGQTAAQTVDTIKYDLHAALLNWRIDPNRAVKGLQYSGGRLLHFDRARIFWQYEYELTVTISEWDGFQLNGVDLTEVDIDVQIDPPQTPAAAGTPPLVKITFETFRNLGLLTTTRTADFLDMLAVNTHFEFTDGAYNHDFDHPLSVNRSLACLQYLGVNRIREGTPNTDTGTPTNQYRDALSILASAGIVANFIVEPGQDLNQLDLLQQAHPGFVASIEGPNETNNFPFSYAGFADGLQAHQAFQQDLYLDVSQDGNLKGLPIYYYTGLDICTTLQGFATHANTHPYPNAGEQPFFRLSSDQNVLFELNPPFPHVITEIGYSTADVDEATQAKGTLNILFGAYKLGFERVFLYQLLAAYDNPSEDTQYGLFHLDYSPKQAATALHNVTTILADSNDTFAVTQLAYTVANLPATGHTLSFQKSNGRFYIVVWAEPPFWDAGTGQPISNAPVNVSVTFAATYSTINVYDPTVQITPIATGSHATSTTVGVSDHPLIIELIAGE